ncbi:MAG: hypothetical protein ACD_63C00076G0003 [uncultured bacterium]|nr:MAG: hypothetical protein ACD_63C00076G0003 [uncultured bacterium]
MRRYKMKGRKKSFAMPLVNLCGYLVYGWNRIGRRNLKKIFPKNILVLSLDEIGDTLLATPALKYLRDAFPKAKIFVACRDRVCEVLDGNTNVDEILKMDMPRMGVPSLKSYKRDFYRVESVIRQIYKKTDDVDFDLGIDLKADIRTIKILKDLKIPVRVSQAIRSGGFWLTHVAPYLGETHEVIRKLSIVNFIKKIKDKSYLKQKMKIFVSDKDRKKAQVVLATNGLERGKQYVVMHAFAGWRPKEWPKDRFAKLADYIREKYDLRTVLVGTEEEADGILEIQDLAKSVPLNVAGQTTVKETAAIIEGAKFFVGNDSGPMHIASAVQTPTVALFGQNIPKRYGPWQNKSIAIYHKIECSPCEQIRCVRKPTCMELITLDEVKKAVDKMLS